MYRSTIALLITLALALAGCANQRVAPEARAPEAREVEPQVVGSPAAEDRATDVLNPEIQSTDVEANGDQGPPRLKPDNDPRYALPSAQKRSLSIFLGSQTFEYIEDDQVVASGKVSTGTKEHPTPDGSFRVLSKDENKRSGKYTNYFNDNTPMPYSLQFHGPYFVHEGWVPGYADSHGCVRLYYEDARLIYARIKIGDPIYVKQEGVARTPSHWPAPLAVF
jgi:lipoprotein-anchoring transpeptidase ErfK/SrfK